MTDETFGQFLIRRFHELAIQHPGEYKSLAEFGKWIGVKQSTFSTWCNDQKTPEGGNVEKLAAKLGPEVYTRLGLAPKITNPKVALIDAIWQRLPKDEQDQWYERALEIHEGEQDRQARGKRTRAG